jgi:hypothetical protein
MASKMALPIAAAAKVMVHSPAPNCGLSVLLIMTVCTAGSGRRIERPDKCTSQM